MIANNDFVLEILVENNLLSAEQAEEARNAASAGGDPIEILIENEILTEEDIARALAAGAGIEYHSLGEYEVQTEALNLLSKDDARRFQVLPVQISDGYVTIATSDPLDIEALDSLRHLIEGVEPEFICTTRTEISQALVQYYGGIEDLAGIGGGEDSGEITIGDMTVDPSQMEEGDEGDAPIIKLVSSLLIEAYHMRASDIHLEPLEKRFRVRFRVDGKLLEMEDPPKKLQSAIISRLKIMSGSMSIAEKRLPQDGRIQVKVQGKPLDLRVSSIPTNHGESIVMRILDKSSLKLGLPELGFMSDDQEVFERLITLPDGILLVTGPTGSGKTTTLYSALHHINKPDRKIITVEDPVEYELGGINQVQVNESIGMSFAAALRSMLRQAPNIIMIGEIRDKETANIAINASLTGHLVFSTLHTNNATAAIPRLIDMGVAPFLTASSIRASQAQRLVRKICPNCKVPHTLTEAELTALRISSDRTLDAQAAVGEGCNQCNNTGFKGRVGIFEIFQLDDEIRHMINDNISASVLRARARQLGMRTMREDGIRKVLAGISTAEEVVSVTMNDTED